jgi:DMSO/TMAO reductase YedYZ molybdopterin-dependent catalytic subunit
MIFLWVSGHRCGCAFPRQLGYKSVKFITRVTVTDSLKGFGKGLGGVNAEGGYSWYAGI